MVSMSYICQKYTMALSCSQVICYFFHLCKLFITYNYTKYPILNIFLKAAYCYNKISLYPRARNKSVLRTPRESINFRAQLLFRARSCASCRRLLSYGRRSFLYDKKRCLPKGRHPALPFHCFYRFRALLISFNSSNTTSFSTLM